MRLVHVAPLLVLATLFASSAVARADRDEGCIDCHAVRSEERLRAPMRQREDVHGRAELGCTSCHSGDPRATDARAHDVAGGFRGVPDAIGVSQVCGRCHDGSREDAADVLAAYRAGAHGTAIAQGRHEAARCTDCHGAHAIEPVTEASAPTSRTEVVGTCTRCHGDAERMAIAGLDAAVPRSFAESVHGRALAEGSEDAPTCADCHGAHQNGGGIEAAQACGGCHEEIRAAFDRGPHASAFTRLGFLDCVECHGSHGIRAADASLLEGLGAVCERCHGAGQEIYAEVERLAASGERVDAARAAWPADDPRRVAMMTAIHRLDAEALDEVLEGAPEPTRRETRRDSREAPTATVPAPQDPWRSVLPRLGALAIVIAIVIAVVKLGRRRSS